MLVEAVSGDAQLLDKVALQIFPDVPDESVRESRDGRASAHLQLCA